MMGNVVAALASGMIAVKTFPLSLEQPEDRHLARGSAASPAFAAPSEVALVGLHLSPKLVAGKLAGYELAEAHEEARRGVAVHAGNLSRCPGGRVNHEQFNELRLMANAQSTFPFEHYCYPKIVA